MADPAPEAPEGLLGRLGRLFSNYNPEAAYSGLLSDPETKSALRSRALASMAGAFAQGAMPVPYKGGIPFAATLGNAAQAAYGGQDDLIKARTQAAQQALYGAQGDAARQNIEFSKAYIDSRRRGDAEPPAPGTPAAITGTTGGARGVLLKGSPELMSTARDAAKAYGVPEDMFLHQINGESGFNPTITNPKSGAAGIAQFLPSTAKTYDVDVNDPVSSLNGAARYMSDLYKQTGSWAGAMRAYAGAKTDAGLQQVLAIPSYAQAYRLAQGADAPPPQAAAAPPAGGLPPSLLAPPGTPPSAPPDTLVGASPGAPRSLLAQPVSATVPAAAIAAQPAMQRPPGAGPIPPNIPRNSRGEPYLPIGPGEAVPAGTPGAGAAITPEQAATANAAYRASGGPPRLPVMPTDSTFGRGMVAPPGAGTATPPPSLLAAGQLPNAPPPVPASQARPPVAPVGPQGGLLVQQPALPQAVAAPPVAIPPAARPVGVPPPTAAPALQPGAPVGAIPGAPTPAQIKKAQLEAALLTVMGKPIPPDTQGILRYTTDVAAAQAKAEAEQRARVGPQTQIDAAQQALITQREIILKQLEAQTTVVSVPVRDPNTGRMSEVPMTREQAGQYLGRVNAAIGAPGGGPQAGGPAAGIPAGKPIYSPTETALGPVEAKTIFDQRKAALDAARSIDTNKEARALIDGGIFAGAGQDAKTAVAKFGNAMGMAGPTTQQTIANTEAYFTAVGRNVLNMIGPLGSGTAVSENDRRFVEAMAGGKHALDEKSIRDILDLNDRVSRDLIKQHNDQVKDVPKGTTMLDLTVPVPEPYRAKLPAGVPEGSVPTGKTYGGKPSYLVPDGKGGQTEKVLH